jgi:hypothetical protein
MQTRCMAACIGHIRLQGLIEMNQDGTWKENRQSSSLPKKRPAEHP